MKIVVKIGGCTIRVKSLQDWEKADALVRYSLAPNENPLLLSALPNRNGNQARVIKKQLRVQEAKRLIGDGLSQSDIARDWGVTPARVNQLLHQRKRKR